MIDDVRAAAAHLVEDYAGERLAAADEPPGLRAATTAFVATALSTDDAERLIRHQIRQLRSTGSRAIPDAYLAYEAIVEDALQRAAAGLRTAMAKAGHLVDAPSFEHGALRRLYDDPRAAVRAELARVPRPSTRPRQLAWSLPPAPWAVDTRHDNSWPPPAAEASIGRRCLPSTALARAEHGPHTGWVQIGLIERHRTPRCRYPDRPARNVLVAAALEAVDDEPPEGLMPFTSLPWQHWTAPWHHIDESLTAERAVSALADSDQALVALRAQLPRTSGLREPPFLLVPVLALVAALGLEPMSNVYGFSLGDEVGPGLVGRLWRSDLVHDGDYEPAFPAVEGVDLLLRPDLFERLHGFVGEARARAGLSISYYSGDEGTDEV